jgi:hypothetical protein
MRRRDFSRNERAGLNARSCPPNCWTELPVEVGYRRESQFRGAAHG